MELSIVIPVYNEEKNLTRCLKSVLNQKTNNFSEIIIINDGSTDNSEKIIFSFMQKNKNIKYLKQSNKGLSSARNRGLNEASGEYIYFLDSDDFLYDDRSMEDMLALMKDKSLDILFGNFAYYYPSENKYEIYELRTKAIHGKVLSGKEMYEKTIDRGLVSMVPTKMFRRSFLMDNSLYFKEGIYYEDTVHTPESFYKAKRVYHYPSPVFYYNQTEVSIIRGQKHMDHNSLFYIAKHFSKMYEDTGWSYFRDIEIRMYKTITVELLKNKKNEFSKEDISKVLSQEILNKYKLHRKFKYHLFYYFLIMYKKIYKIS